MKPYFITIEGIEGVGKSTLVAAAKAILQERGLSVITTREPGGTELAEKIRALLLDHTKEQLLPVTELLLLFAARSQHLHQLIKPALAAGTTVICDRFTDSSYAYQGWGRRLPLTYIAQCQAMVDGDIQPDITILLDADPAVVMQRKLGEAYDRIESETIEFFRAVREGYLFQAQREPARFRVIDATKPLESVLMKLRNSISTLE